MQYLILYAQQFELKFSIDTKFDTLISNINSYVQVENHYDVTMT